MISHAGGVSRVDQCAQGRRSCPFGIVMALIGCGVAEKPAGVILKKHPSHRNLYVVPIWGGEIYAAINIVSYLRPDR